MIWVIADCIGGYRKHHFGEYPSEHMPEAERVLHFFMERKGRYPAIVTEVEELFPGLF